MTLEKVYDGRFKSRSYLRTYYGSVGGPGAENYEILRFLAQEAFQGIPRGTDMLEFGCGPVIDGVISASSKLALFDDNVPVGGRIDMVDYKNANLREVQEWRNGSPAAYNWKPFVRTALALEGKITLTGDGKTKEEEVRRKVDGREELMRMVTRDFYKGDAFQQHPLDPEFFEYYPLVMTKFVAESITETREDWEQVVQNICSLVKKDGGLIMAAIDGASRYHVGKREFIAFPVSEEMMINLLEKLGFEVDTVKSISANGVEESSKEFHGYTGMTFVRGRKKLHTLRPSAYHMTVPAAASSIPSLAKI